MFLSIKSKMVRNSFAVFLGYSFVLVVQACGSSTVVPDQATKQAPLVRALSAAPLKSLSLKGSCCKGAPSKLRSLVSTAKESKMLTK